MIFEETSEFQRDFKKLLKKYRTLRDDFEVLKKAIAAAPAGNGTKHWNIITKIEAAHVVVLKVRLSCRALKIGNDFRVVYAYDDQKVVILFLEIYSKGRQTTENTDRITTLLRKYPSE